MEVLDICYMSNELYGRQLAGNEPEIQQHDDDASDL